ncbi:MAG TPA: ABC transporter transmembrane domain-containing protein, partial [Ktedonobacteraceae bacterium]|nr:ABC transporter transmembrane domain-containing protein [Ktedonobacteraceae bacterium]
MKSTVTDTQTQENTKKKKSYSYVDYRRQHIWSENSLARSDENEELSFDWREVHLFFPYIKRFRWQLLVSAILMLVYTGLNLANPYLIGLAIDSFITHRDLPGLAQISVILLVLNIAMWQAQYWQVWTMSWAGQQILYYLSSDMFAHLHKLSLSFYDRTQIGRVMSRLQSDIDILESMLSSGLLSILGSLVSLVGIIAA